MNSNKKSLAFCAADVEHEERANTNRLNADETNLLILRLSIVFYSNNELILKKKVLYVKSYQYGRYCL